MQNWSFVLTKSIIYNFIAAVVEATVAKVEVPFIEAPPAPALQPLPEPVRVYEEPAKVYEEPAPVYGRKFF